MELPEEEEEYSWSDDSEEHLEERTFVLHDAAEKGDVSIIRQLLALTEDAEVGAVVNTTVLGLNSPDDDKCSPLHVALLHGHLDVLEALLQAGADPNQDMDGCPPICLAVCLATHMDRLQFSQEALRLLLDYKANPHARDDGRRSALHWSCSLGLVPQCLALLEAAKTLEEAESQEAAAKEETKAKVIHMKDSHQDTPLHLAARFNHGDVVDLLVATGDPGETRHMLRAKNRSGRTPLHEAAFHGAVESASRLVHVDKEGCQVEDIWGTTAAGLARTRGYKGLASYLEDFLSGGAPTGTHSRPPTLIVAPQQCHLHRTSPDTFPRGGACPPPENVNRLNVIAQPGVGCLRGSEFSGLKWCLEVGPVAMSDVLRIHDWPYVKDVQEACATLDPEGKEIGRLDADTAICRHTLLAALHAAGAVCHAIDQVMTLQAHNAFCVIRPPGHHAGPRGVVPSVREPDGSQGFCFLNNVAIGAAYAMNTYRHHGIKKVVVLDFDVHHGNGTQACVLGTVPSLVRTSFKDALSTVTLVHPSYKPWRDVDDTECILFGSVQGFGLKFPSAKSYVYPGSGATSDTAEIKSRAEGEQGAQKQGGGGDGGEDGTPEQLGVHQDVGQVAEEDPLGEFHTVEGEEVPDPSGPRVVNVGIPGPGFHPRLWRRAWRDKVLPAVVNFDPDLILVSAGFDAHRKDDINFRYVGVTEADFEWLTDQLVQVANRCCEGRLVTALEGGYHLSGGVVSALARSAAAHVRALMEPHRQVWDPKQAARERAHEQSKREEKRAKAGGVTAPMDITTQAPRPGGGSGHLNREVDRADQQGDSTATPASKRARRGPAVDYVALNAEWEKARAAMRQQVS